MIWYSLLVIISVLYFGLVRMARFVFCTGFGYKDEAVCFIVIFFMWLKCLYFSLHTPEVEPYLLWVEGGEGHLKPVKIQFFRLSSL